MGVTSGGRRLVFEKGGHSPLPVADPVPRIGESGARCLVRRRPRGVPEGHSLARKWAVVGRSPVGVRKTKRK